MTKKLISNLFGIITGGFILSGNPTPTYSQTPNNYLQNQQQIIAPAVKEKRNCEKRLEILAETSNAILPKKIKFEKTYKYINKKN